MRDGFAGRIQTPGALFVMECRMIGMGSEFEDLAVLEGLDGRIAAVTTADPCADQSVDEGLHCRVSTHGAMVSRVGVDSPVS